jgi:hypothetical protein
MVRRVKTQAIKANKAYRVDELAVAACVCVPTIRNWIKAGLQVVDNKRPTMIMGFQAIDFLKTCKAKARRPLAQDTFYCLRCKAPRPAFGAMADYIPSSATAGRLKALCAACGCQCNRNIRASDLPEIGKFLDVATRANQSP